MKLIGGAAEMQPTDDSATVLGAMDVTVDSDLATIDTVAVHPDHQHQGHGRALLAEARTRASALSLNTLDAWTRDLPDTLRWYRAMGFTESDHYLYVYANYYTEPGEPDRAIGIRRRGLKPMAAFLHASLDEEQQLRGEFSRIHVCRRFALPL
ncbi:GNAT family N-acetyltransferase [Streptomyces sp. LN590]|uniref:GNAT family N-acetyltransferase n=1 Tax=Streptomyces sp. LN590 TaxID=3112980 RepID=UPI003718C230